MGEKRGIRRALLRELSGDSRMPVTDLAKRVGCSRNTVMATMRALEKDAGLWYTIELDRRELGFVQSHIWRVNFGRKPDFRHISAILGAEQTVQLVARTEGDFDILLKIVTDSGSSYVESGRRILRNLSAYTPTVRSSTVVKKRFGLVKLADELTGSADFSRFGMDQLDRGIIMELNSNSRISCKEMAKKLGKEEATIRYRLDRIIKSGLIKKFTVASKMPKEGYLAAFFMSKEFSPGSNEREAEAEKFYAALENGSNHFNVLQYLTLTIPDDVVFGIAHFRNEENAIKEVVMSHRRMFREDSPEVSMARIKEVTKGNLAFRNLDIEQELRKAADVGVRR